MHHYLFDFIEKHMILTQEEKEAISELDLFKSVKKGDVLLKEGQYSDKGYFVIEGCLRSYYIVQGEEKTTAFYVEMEGVTPQCVITKEKSSYFISAVTDSIISTSDPSMEEQMFQRFPRFETLCRILSEKHLAVKQMDFDAFRTSSPEERYLDLLRSRPDLLQRVPQHQIASYLGITPQSLSRMRARITRRNQSV